MFADGVGSRPYGWQRAARPRRNRADSHRIPQRDGDSHRGHRAHVDRELDCDGDPYEHRDQHRDVH